MEKGDREYQTEAEEEPSGIDVARYYHLLLARKWILIGSVSLLVILALIYLWVKVPLYASTAVIEVEQQPNKVVNIQDIAPEDLRPTEALKTIEQALSSRSVLLRVVKANNLGDDPNFVSKDDEAPLKPDEAMTYNEQLVDILDEKVSATLRRGTRLIDVVVYDADPRKAQVLAESFVQEFIKECFEQKVGVSRLAGGVLLGEAERLRAKLEKSEQALQQFKESHDAVSLEEKQNIVVEKLKDLNAKVTTAKAERLRLEADLAQIQMLNDQPKTALLQVASVSILPEVAEFMREINDKESQFALLKERYLPRHPKYIEAEGQLKSLRASLDKALVRARDLVSQTYRSARANEDRLQDALREQEKSALELNRISIPYNVLLREVESDSALYTSIQTRLKETDITKTIGQDAISIVQPPSLPYVPSKPKKKLILLLAVCGGVMIGVGMIFGLNAIDQTLKTVDQTEAQVGLPVIGAIPDSGKGESEDGFPILREPHGVIAEAFRTMRTSLSLVDKQATRTAFLFTSAVPGEGKSFCASNYAISRAQAGSSTLLIDGDLRLPSLGKMFFHGETHVGLCDVISGKARFEDGFQTANPANLCVMTAGHRVQNPAELLSGGGFDELLKEALERFECVVVDSAPVIAVSDSLLLAKSLQSVCLVVRAGKTGRRAVLRACRNLAEAGSTPIGVILNCVPTGSGMDFYYHYSTGEYGKGVYGAITAETT